MTVLEILTTRFNESQLKGFREGYFDESEAKLIAYTLLPVSDPEYENLKIFYESTGWSMVTSVLKDERHRIYSADKSTYTTKNLDQMVEESLLVYVRILFHGAFYNNEWYIKSDCCYYDKRDETKVLELIKKDMVLPNKKWNDSVFRILPETEERIDYGKLTAMLSEETGRALNWWFKDYKEVLAFAAKLKPWEIPKCQEKQSAELREFAGQPWITAHIKQEIKNKVNRSFETYINKAVFIPFAQMLKNQQSDKFHKTYTLYHQDNYPLIYPHSKEQVLCVVKVINQYGASRLYYFLYIFDQKKIFEWRYPTPSSADGHHSFYILEDIKDLSGWGKEFDIFEPSVTMDDPHFWNEFVFKKEKDNYKYLVPVEIKNNQHDIYPLF